MNQFDDIDRDQPLSSLSPDEVLAKLDLSHKGLDQVRSAAKAGDSDAALDHLLSYYRKKFPLEPLNRSVDTTVADDTVNHTLQWGPYEKADYGEEINWEWDPRGDIEWVAAVCRFYWAGPLATAFRATGNQKYAQSFVDLTTDWISKHKLEDRKRTHPVYEFWKGYVWLDIQTGIRATNICLSFKQLVHGKGFTGGFLRLLLASLYDHQVKTEKIPMGIVHNKAIFEQRGFINVAYHFNEFAESRRWLELALERSQENFLLQTTTDGVQREWSYGYHSGVLRDAIEIRERMAEAGIPFPENLLDRIRLMYDYIFAIATPDLGAPMFGDGSRSLPESDDRSTWPLYASLIEATKLFGDQKYAARAQLELDKLPDQKSFAFKEAGMYVMRNAWGTDQIHLGLHCSEKAISSHDQPDNGTFELYAYGRWLMPDTGFYTYGHDAEGRAWHRQTRVHQTLTLDGQDSLDDGRHLLWQSDDAGDVLVVENGSYDGLVHRRSIWFVDHSFFVLFDEAIGDTPGQLDLHFQFAPGEVAFDVASSRAHSVFDDANVLVVCGASDTHTLVEEEGWFAWSYGHRVSRKACRFELAGSAPTNTVSCIIPYRGTDVPDVSFTAVDTQTIADRVSVTVEAFGNRWNVGRDLLLGQAWLKKE
ncbi:MAG: alginate lyase family protein [Candidatus Latescibacterota bacterium]|nr:alginate lyase family protein [Candidatus Latescibacterota bacterium]